MDENSESLREDLDRVLLLPGSEPRPGFEAGFEGLTSREVDSLLQPGTAPENGLTILARIHALHSRSAVLKNGPVAIPPPVAEGSRRRENRRKHGARARSRKGER